MASEADFGIVRDKPSSESELGIVREKSPSPVKNAVDFFRNEVNPLSGIFSSGNRNLLAGVLSGSVEPFAKGIRDIVSNVAPNMLMKPIAPMVEQNMGIDKSSIPYQVGEVIPFAAGAYGAGKSAINMGSKLLNPESLADIIGSIKGKIYPNVPEELAPLELPQKPNISKPNPAEDPLVNAIEAKLEKRDYVGDLSKNVEPFLENMSGGTSIPAINSKLAENIKDAYKKVSDMSRNKYMSVFANERTDAPFRVGGNQREALEKITLNPYSPSKLNHAIGEFIIDPSTMKAHELQSTIGSISRNMSKPNNSLSEKNFGYELSGIQKNIVNSINDHFVSTGQQKLADDYNDATNFFAKNVIPYRTIGFLKNIVAAKGRESPANLADKLSSDNSLLTNVLDHLNSFSPQSNELILLSKLSKNNAISSDIAKGITIDDPDKFANNLENILHSYRGGSMALQNNLSKLLERQPGEFVNYNKSFSNILDYYKNATESQKRFDKYQSNLLDQLNVAKSDLNEKYLNEKQAALDEYNNKNQELRESYAKDKAEREREIKDAIKRRNLTEKLTKIGLGGLIGVTALNKARELTR